MQIKHFDPDVDVDNIRLIYENLNELKENNEVYHSKEMNWNLLN